MGTDTQAEAAMDLVHWATRTQHRRAPERGYTLDEAGDLAAWRDRLSTRIAEDEAVSTRGRRRALTP